MFEERICVNHRETSERMDAPNTLEAVATSRLPASDVATEMEKICLRKIGSESRVIAPAYDTATSD